MTLTTRLGHRKTLDGAEHLVFTRTFTAPLDDVWAACTEPARMERWIGTWTGDPDSGVIAFRMTAEGDDVPEEIYDVDVCEPPRRFVLRSRDATGFTEDGSGPAVTWQHTLELRESDGVTTLEFTQLVPAGPVGADMVASVGPGWDYYLDRLVAVESGTALADVDFDPYRERADHYRSLFA